MRLRDIGQRVEQLAAQLAELGGGGSSESSVEDFQALALQNDWLNGTEGMLRFYKDRERVYLAGSIQHVAGTLSGEPIIQLPAGYAPSGNLTFRPYVEDRNTGAKINDVTITVGGETGIILPHGVGGFQPMIVLEGISWRAGV